MRPNDERKKRQHPALEMIEDAMKRGDFDNLPGKGKPLNLDSFDLNDPLGMAGKIRKNANIGAPWESLEHEIEISAQRAEKAIVAAYGDHSAGLARAKNNQAEVEKQWKNALAAFEQQCKEINSRILTYNLLVPRQLSHLQKPQLKVKDFLLRLGIDEK